MPPVQWCVVLARIQLMSTVFLFHRGNSIVYMQSECGHTVTSHGDIIYSQASLYYQPRANCILTLLAPHPGQRIRLQFVDIDIKSDKSCQSNHLKVSNVDSVSQVFCGQQPPGDMMSSGAWLQLEFKSDGMQNRSGRGFQMVFTLINQDLRCTGHQLFRCANGDCISSTLRCDAVDHCGDGSDEAQHGTCNDEDTLLINTSDITLTTIVFGTLALLFTACFFVAIISQCFIHIGKICKKCCRAGAFQRGDAALTECQTGESMVRLLDITEQEVNNPYLNAQKKVDADFKRMEEDKIQKPLENETNGQTLGRFTVHKVQHTEDTDKCDHGNNRRDEADVEPLKDGGMTDESPRKLNIGRFSVQRVENANMDVIPVSMINMTDSTKRIPRRKVAFVLNPGMDEIISRKTKVKFVFHSDPVPPSPSSSTSSKRSILKKNPKYPDYQSYESKLTSSLIGSTDNSSDEDVFISDDAFEDSDESNDDRMRDVEGILDTPRTHERDLKATMENQVPNINTDITIHDNPLTPEVEIRCLLHSQGTSPDGIYGSNIPMRLLNEKSYLDVEPYGFTVNEQNDPRGS